MYGEAEPETIKIRLFEQDLDLILSPNEVELLYQNMGNISLAEWHEFLQMHWHELFAVLALCFVERTFSELHNQATWPPKHWLPKPSDSEIACITQEYLGMARQAVTYAETLKGQTDIFKRMSSQQGRHAAAKRHEPSKKLRAAVLALYKEKYTNRSNRDSAVRILSDLIRQGKVRHDEGTNQLYFEDQLVLQTDDPEHRFAIWIGEASKAATNGSVR